VRGVSVQYPAGTHGRYSAYCWQQYDVTMTSWSSIEEVSKRYHQNFLHCNNNEITTFNSFCEKEYAIAFFKVRQQQTTGEVAHSITVFVGRYFLSATVKVLLKLDSICQSYAQMKKSPVFYDSQCSYNGLLIGSYAHATQGCHFR